MSQPGCSRDVAVASTPYDPVLVMPAGQVVMQRTIRRIRPVINISLHEPGIGADPRGQAPRLPHRRSGEIQSRHRGTQPRQRHRVGADVTLQVHTAQPADGAQPGRSNRTISLRKSGSVAYRSSW